MSDGKISSSGDAALRVGNVQTACVALSWALDTLAAEEDSTMPPRRKFEVIAGVGFMLELLSKELGEVYARLSEG